MLDKAKIDSLAAENNFVGNTLEKVLRLVDILKYFQRNPLTRDTFALKGGTAINLTFFDLPRLSVDIDVDYDSDEDRETMLASRQAIKDSLGRYMASQRYSLEMGSKSRFSLDSEVYAYQNRHGQKERLKLEVNYSLRMHLFPLEKRVICPLLGEDTTEILMLAPMEIFAAKINALLSRAAVRDLYDTYNLISSGMAERFDRELFRKSIIFYTAISQKVIPSAYSFKEFQAISSLQLKTDLLPVIHKGVFVDLNQMKQVVTSYLESLLILESGDRAFLENFSQGNYRPSLLFPDHPEIVKRIEEHPMAVWKMQKM